MKLLVTGPNGFIGTHLLTLLSEEGVETIAVVKDKSEDVSRISHLPKVQIVYCELSEIEKLPEIVLDRDIYACIHLAWAGSSGDARADYNIQLRNVSYTMDLIKVLSEMNIKRFIGAGTLAEKDILKTKGY